MTKDLKKSLLKHDRMVPRYTSYPTAPHFKTQADQGWFVEKLKAIPDGEDLSLYVHIPFCPKLCWFCGCNTRITNHYDAVRDYTYCLLKEVGMVAHILEQKRLKVSHLHFGGGSPTILNSDDFSKIITTLKENFFFNDDAEIAIEIDPRNSDGEKIRAYKECGVNRVSLGVQDFNSKVMEAVNRPQSFEMVQSVIKDFRTIGINNINIDLMYGLPHQDIETIEDCARLATSLNPDRISLFGYAHVPWLKKHMRLIDENSLPLSSQRYDLFEASARILEDDGYISIGIDHFARKEDSLCEALISGQINRNFQGYTNDSSKYMIAFGASAISQLGNMYAQNVIHLPQYRDCLNAGLFPVEKNCLLDREDELIADIIKELMCYLSVNPRAVASRRGMQDYNFSEAYIRLAVLELDGLILIEPDGTIHAVLRQAARLACACFDTYLTPATSQRHVTSA